jgi:hypothetical protein
MRHCVGTLVALFCAFAGPALADRRALAVDAGVGVSVLRVLAPYADTAASQVGSAPAIWIDARYGLTNSIELTTTAFAEPSVPYYVSGTDLIHEAVLTLERKAQQVEARAMDLRMRYDAQKLRATLGALDVSPKLERLIEAAQRDNESQGHLLQLAGEVRDVLKQSARDTESIKLVADWLWDSKLDKDAEAKRLSTTLKRMGASTLDATVHALLTALAHKYTPSSGGG